MPVYRPLAADQARVLIVEDEVSLRKLLVQTAAGWGFCVESVWSGEDAIARNQVAPFDIAVLDYHLPRMNGIETLDRLREHSPRLQAVMLTGFGSVDVAKQALHLDVVEFLTKPCNKGELEQALDRALRRIRVSASCGPNEIAATGNEIAAGATLDDVERLHILATLSRNEGKRSVTARELGVTRRTLLNKLKRYERQGLVPP
jgi:DNA-binding NtrC family response regulator